MAFSKARYVQYARAQFQSLMEMGPNSFGPSYKDTLLSQPPWQATQAAKSVRETRSSLIQTRVRDLRRRSSPTHPFCLRCGEKGHRAFQCRNALVCFNCHQIGHKSFHCLSSASTHTTASSSSSHLPDPSSFPAMVPYPNRRGNTRSRPYHNFGNRIPRHYQPPIPPPTYSGQIPPDRPSQGSLPSVIHNPGPIQQPMQQVPPDRPLQPRQRSAQPRPPPISEIQTEQPLPPRIVQPPVLMFHSTQDSEAINRELQLSFLLDDIAAWGPDKIERFLRSSYPPFLWRVAVFDEFIYVIQAPSNEWLLAATRKKWLRMDEVQFPILKWDPMFNAGKRLTSVWIRIHGFPIDLFYWEEFNRLLSPYGAIVLELDPGTRNRYDYRFARVRIGIGDISTLPKQHNITHRNPSGFVSTFDIDFETETDTSEIVSAWRGRLNGRPYPNGTQFGVSPVIPPPLVQVLPEQHNTNTPMETELNPSQTQEQHNAPTSSHNPPLSTSRSSSFHLSQSPTHTPSLFSPLTRRGGHVSLPRKPSLGSSPTDKGKTTLPSCTQEHESQQRYGFDTDEDSDGNWIYFGYKPTTTIC
ncbi:Cellular nucleic acid-binding protein [Carex littledalei]|uniref:Cellular nucleic acid-binding protein n=1 Tax=Carex littledalei TaxID=544730 RepID=A0A833QSS5_9POAL|nr:Cellular nucleic acid-binding protein [Carex littledalei]